MVPTVGGLAPQRDWPLGPSQGQRAQAEAHLATALRMYDTASMGAGVSRSPLDDFLGESPAATALRDSVRRLLGRLAGQQVLPPVRLVGEAGAGKDLLADVLHRAGPRNGKPFVNVRVSAIPATLLEPELLGWEDPARERGGWGHSGFIRAAHQGTLAMSEFDLVDHLGGMLAEILRRGTVRRVNGACDEPADVWLIGTTHRELDVAAPLRPVVLRVPPLRERGDDVLLLAEHYLARFARDHQRPARTLSRRERVALRAYYWPGNVRQLMQHMESAVVVPERRIDPHLSPPVRPTIKTRPRPPVWYQ